MRELAREALEDSVESPVKLSIDFGGGRGGGGGCLGCGNCLSGCPYDAKNSTDKNYLALVIKNGCKMRTGCRARYMVQNPDFDRSGGRGMRGRRWRVCFDDLDYVCADFVVLSAGVLGTTEILFRSQQRGLKLSERLGFGFSCNGNNVAYVAGSPAPLNAYGLNKQQFLKIPFEDRPGPAITSSHSSLGFTIQSGVLPTAYPYLIFKGIATYGWPNGHWFLHGVIDKLKCLIGLKNSQAMVLNAMGYDESDGRITLDEKSDKMCFVPSNDPLLPRKIGAFQKLAKRLGGILFMSRYRSTSVQLLRGCNSGSNPSLGVCNSNGQVFSHDEVHEGIYVCDASVIPCSVGINPCLTIATLAEHISQCLVKDIMRYKSIGSLIRISNLEPNSTVDINGVDEKIYVSVKSSNEASLVRKDMETVMVKETLRGHLGGMPCTVHLVMRMSLGDSSTKNAQQLLVGCVGGYVAFQAVGRNKLYIIDGKVDMCSVNDRTPYTQYMHYHLLLASASGTRHVLEGKKIMNPYILASYAWRETRTLHTNLRTVTRKDEEEIGSNDSKGEMINLHGELQLSLIELLRSIVTMKGNGKFKFVGLLLRSFLRTYVLQTPRCDTYNPIEMIEGAYPSSTLHEMRTVLLLNGHSTESFYLPTEPRDLVRTLLDEGYETWLLQPRLHPLHPSNDFTIEDIGKFDVPAGKNKILPMFENSNDNLRQRILKSIARLIPRYERCTCDECEVFSGIFGNTFWHENVSPSLHWWLNKQCLPRLPMPGFPHLRKICIAGFIVNSNGENSYLVHPERMALPTLYVSGGRSLLVTPEMSHLANKYMRLHQPSFLHKRVVVEGFGHSDLLMGEESYKKGTTDIKTEIAAFTNKQIIYRN
ncbi:Long-chain-alcohol oxidase FAO1 [Acorus calamus]|uniref:Cholesterol oxidase n=1 Tax=Acorus calamus TaxID=4465 RepID=A0AAV9FEA4_ACOCL|nr:Long-chain-alcohol oxidase FAO1 [Acorus calamus]